MADIIIVGTTHFSAREDIFTEKFQTEMEIFSERLAAFDPTKIAVELPRRYQSRLDDFYRDFDLPMLNEKTLLGNLEVYNHISSFFSDNEMIQLGFRIARKLGHKTVYAVDEDIELSDELLSKIQSDFSPDIYLERMNTLAKGSDTLEEQYRVWNSREHILSDHNLYIMMNKVNPGNYEGSQLFLQWYERNLKIYSNLQNLAADKDRILLIIGYGHLHILQELTRSDENMTLIDWTHMVM